MNLPSSSKSCRKQLRTEWVRLQETRSKSSSLMPVLVSLTIRTQCLRTQRCSSKVLSMVLTCASLLTGRRARERLTRCRVIVNSQVLFRGLSKNSTD
jgi:hypothetical protein